MKVSARCLWKIPLEGSKILTLDAFASPQWVKSWASRSLAQDLLSFSDPPSTANLRVCRLWGAPVRWRSLVTAHCSPKSSKDSFWTAVYRVTRKWAWVRTMFHPCHTLGPHTFFESVRTGILCHWGKESSFQGCSWKKLELIRKQQFLGADSVSHNLKRSWAQVLFIKAKA